MAGKKQTKPFSPPSGKQHPPAAGAHKLTDIQRIPGGYGAGPQQPGVHPSLRKPGLMK